MNEDGKLAEDIARVIELYTIMDNRAAEESEKVEYETLKGDEKVQTALNEYIENDALSPFGLDAEELKKQVRQMKLAATYDIEIEIVKGSWSPLSANSTWSEGQITLHAENGDFKKPVMQLVEAPGDSEGSYHLMKDIGDFSFRPTTSWSGRWGRPEEQLLRIDWPKPDPTLNKIIFFSTTQGKEDFKKKHSDWEYIKTMMDKNDQQLKAAVRGMGITDDEIDAAFTVAKSMTGELGSIDDREPVVVMILHKKNTGEGAAAELWLNELLMAPQRYREGRGSAEVPGDIVRRAAAAASARGGGRKHKRKSKRRRTSKRRKSTKRKYTKRRKSKTRRRRR